MNTHVTAEEGGDFLKIHLGEDRVERSFDTLDGEVLESFWAISDALKALMKTRAMGRLQDASTDLDLLVKHHAGNHVLIGFLYQLEVLERSLEWTRNSIDEAQIEMDITPHVDPEDVEREEKEGLSMLEALSKMTHAERDDLCKQILEKLTQ